jgi:hypothetical protein
LLFSNTNPQSQFYFVSNSTLNSSSQFTYTCNGRAGKINIDDGSISLDVASCAAAGCVISWINGINILNTGNVGIGTSSPASKLDICGPQYADLMMMRLLDQASQATGTGGGIGFGGKYNSTDFTEFGLIRGLKENSTSGEYGGYLSFSTRPNLGQWAERIRVTSAGNIGISTTSPSYRLHVNGTFYAAGSSQDYKEGICNYNTDSCLFMCLKPKTYQYKDEWKHLGKDLKSETQIGLIAEEVAEVMPELAILVNEDDNKVVRNVDYEKLSIVLLAEVQKLRHEMDQLKQN